MNLNTDELKKGLISGKISLDPEKFALFVWAIKDNKLNRYTYSRMLNSTDPEEQKKHFKRVALKVIEVMESINEVVKVNA